MLQFVHLGWLFLKKPVTSTTCTTRVCSFNPELPNYNNSQPELKICCGDFPILKTINMFGWGWPSSSSQPRRWNPSCLHRPLNLLGPGKCLFHEEAGVRRCGWSRRLLKECRNKHVNKHGVRIQSGFQKKRHTEHDGRWKTKKHVLSIFAIFGVSTLNVRDVDLKKPDVDVKHHGFWKMNSSKTNTVSKLSKLVQMNQNYQTWWIPEINLLEPHKENKT